MTINSVSNSPGFVSLDAFAQAAEKGGDVYVTVVGEQFHVLGTGTTPSGRSVAWVATDADTTAMFSDALSRTYGNGIASTVARELGIAGGAGTPLSARTITQALDMAQTSRDALDGVDFMTRLDHNAAAGSAGFRSACAQLGIAPESLSGAQRQAIDMAMEQRFNAAAPQGPVSAEQARQWLVELLPAARQEV
ncbi:hypothetical protein CEG14_19645 [Bordetella genomosp. 1]|uniref:Uncharacterized protein n=1 Tax=Bordetella genomosp. 1 TaxID=1395607 RepID=A0A261S8G3_9BORD|nr:hypothetical protein CEG14_19645 [Bordetella genomosp. 1]